MNPRHRFFILGSIALLAAAGVIGAFMGGERAKPRPSRSSSSPQDSAGLKISGPQRDAGPGLAASRVADPAQPIPPAVGGPVLAAGSANTPSEAIKEAIHEAAIQYDPKELPKIQPYLLHPDAEVRAAALDGMLVLGHPAASPLLRAAAKQMTTPQEAVKMLEAADYLELPSGSLRRSAGARSVPATIPKTRSPGK